MSSFFSDFGANFLATLLAAAVTIVAVAEIKVRRIKSELYALSDYLQSAQRTRCAHTNGTSSQQAECMTKVRKQLEELMREISAAKEGVLSFSHAFRAKIRLLESDVTEVLGENYSKNWMLLLFGSDSSVEQEFRSKIVALGERADELAGDLWFGELLIP